ncbi:Solute carrier family 35 member C2 (Partial), partial [Seminavis robusta]
VDFAFKGFLLCLMASVLSGARWTLVQLKIQKMDPPLKTSVATMRVLAPFMCVTMVVVSILLENPREKLKDYMDSWKTISFVLGLGMGGACLAVLMILCEFYLIMHSNAVVLMIGGVIKEILTIFIGVGFFGDTINFVNFLGCCVVFAGVILYKVTHHMEKPADGEHIPIPTMDKDFSENDNNALNGKERLQPDSGGLDSSDRFLDEDSERWREREKDGIELPASNSLRSRNSSDGTNANASPKTTKMMIV